MIDANVFLALPVKFKDICEIYPPKVKEVVANPALLQIYKILTYTQEDIEDLLAEHKEAGIKVEGQTTTPTPLEFLLINSYSSEQFKKLVLDGLEAFLHEPVTLIYNEKLILIGKTEELAQITDFSKFRYLSEESFFDFQNALRGVMGQAPVVPPDPDENMVVKKVKAAARRRERLKNKKSGGTSLTTLLGAICCMGIGLTPLNIGEISYASIDIIVTLYQQKEKYQADLESLWAGANPKKVHPKYWIRDKSDFNEIKI